MEPFEVAEITDEVMHELDISTKTCDICGGNLIDIREVVSKDEFDVEINVVKRRHEYRIYECVLYAGNKKTFFLSEPNIL